MPRNSKSDLQQTEQSLKERSEGEEMNITRGKQKQAVRGLLYGTEGVGKTTLASSIPRALLLDTERGSLRVNCARTHVDKWTTLTSDFRDIAEGKSKEWSTIVIDSITAAERMLIDAMCAKGNKKSLASWPYGEGYGLFEKGFGDFLKRADRLIDAGYNVLFIGHSSVKHTDDPVDGGWDRFEVDLDKRSSSMIKRWADVVAFMRFKQKIRRADGEKARGIGGQERVIYTARTAAYDAKSRLELPDEIGDLKTFTSIFGEQKGDK